MGKTAPPSMETISRRACSADSAASAAAAGHAEPPDPSSVTAARPPAGQLTPHASPSSRRRAGERQLGVNPDRPCGSRNVGRLQLGGEWLQFGGRCRGGSSDGDCCSGRWCTRQTFSAQCKLGRWSERTVSPGPYRLVTRRTGRIVRAVTVLVSRVSLRTARHGVTAASPVQRVVPLAPRH